MGWARVDDGFHDHPKADSLSLAAVGLWTLNLTWAARHRRTAGIPGFIPEARVRKLAGRHTAALVAELTTPPPEKECGLWEVVDGGYLIHDFADYLPKARDPVEAAANARAAAAKRWGT